MPDPQPFEASPASPTPRLPGPRSPAPALIVAALLLVAATIAAYVLATRMITRTRPAGAPGALSPSGSRALAPPFTLPSLRAQEQIALADFRGHVVVLNFFASWCGPCELEAADLEQTWESVRGRGVVFLGVAIQDRYQDAQAFLTKHGITYPAVFDADGQVVRAYRITGIPTTVLIDVDGRVAARHAGIFVGEEGRARLRAWIDAARGAAP